MPRTVQLHTSTVSVGVWDGDAVLMAQALCQSEAPRDDHMTPHVRLDHFVAVR